MFCPDNQYLKNIGVIIQRFTGPKCRTKAKKGGLSFMKLLNKDEFIANEIRYYFIKNNLQEGDKLPSERSFAETFSVQRATIRAAYQILEEEGVIEIKALKVDQMTALVKKSGITYDKDGNVLQYLHTVMNNEWVQFQQSDQTIERKINEVLNHGL